MEDIMKLFTFTVSVIMLLSLSGYSEGSEKDSLEVTGMKFPEIKATSLAGSEVTLPDSADGPVRPGRPVRTLAGANPRSAGQKEPLR